MKKQHFSLLPGVGLTVLETNKFKTNCLSLNILRPLGQEEAAMNALLPDVLLRGCKICPDMGEIAAWLDERYGSGIQSLVRKKGESQLIGFMIDYINEKYASPEDHLTEDICRLLGSFLMEPVLEADVFKKDFVDGEKVNLINAIMAGINDKRTYASIRLRQEMFKGEHYGVSKNGEVKDVEAITAESLYGHYRRILAASQIELIFVGETDVEKLKAALTEVLKELPRGELDKVETVPGPVPQEVKEIMETMDVNQGKLVMGFRTGITARDGDFPAMLLMNGIYGGSLTSKLFMNVREKLSLCYYASSGIDREKGVMIVSSGVDTKNYTVAKEEILRQLEACRAGDVSEEELFSTRSYLVSSLRAGEDSVFGMEDYCLGQIIGGYEDSTADLAARLERVTLSEIAAAANKVKLDTIYFLKGEEA